MVWGLELKVKRSEPTGVFAEAFDRCPYRTRVPKYPKAGTESGYEGGYGYSVAPCGTACRSALRTTRRGTSLIRNSAFLGPYSRTMHRALWWVLGGGRFLMSEVPLYHPGNHSHSQFLPATKSKYAFSSLSPEGPCCAVIFAIIYY